MEPFLGSRSHIPATKSMHATTKIPWVTTKIWHSQVSKLKKKKKKEAYVRQPYLSQLHSAPWRHLPRCRPGRNSLFSRFLQVTQPCLWGMGPHLLLVASGARSSCGLWLEVLLPPVSALSDNRNLAVRSEPAQVSQ